MCNKKIESNLEEKKQRVDLRAILALTEQRGTVVPNKFRCIIPRLNPSHFPNFNANNNVGHGD